MSPASAPFDEPIVNQIATAHASVVGEEISGFLDLLQRYGVLATQLTEKRLLYLLAELDAGQTRAVSSPDLFVFNLLTPFRYDWRDMLRRLRHRDPNPGIVVLVPKPAAEVVGDAIRAGADDVLYEAELSFPRLVWQRIGGLMEPSSSIPELPRPSEADDSKGSVLAITATNLRAPSGRLDATRIAKQLGVPIARLATMVGVSRQALSQTPDSPGIQSALEPVGRVLHLLDDALSPDDTAKWLRAPHRDLDASAPLDLVMSGRADVVVRLLEAHAATR